MLLLGLVWGARSRSGWVADNGAGLSPEDQARLFRPFERAHDAVVDGEGLGLSIVRRMVQRLGGTVGVDSLPGVGGTVWFALPRAAE